MHKLSDSKLFFQLLQISLSVKDSLSYIPSTREWLQLFKQSHRQTLVGIVFYGVQRLYKEQPETCANLPNELRMKWLGMAATIQMRNEKMDLSTKKALDLFRKEGFCCYVLKGQGIASLYGELGKLRQSGDIDIWVDGTRGHLYEFAKRMYGKIDGLTYHHIHFPFFADVEIEAHTWPSFLSSPFRNKRLQTFCRLHRPMDDSRDTPSLAFNRVFILLHCYQHFVRRGVGLRQLMDYYFVLKQGCNEAEKQDAIKWCRNMGLGRFLGAMMYVMKSIFRLEEKDMLCEADEKAGEFLLKEILLTGNMGHTDTRINHKMLQSAIGRYVCNLKRDLSIMRICPHEALWEPFWGIYQYFWCKKTIRKYNN